MGFTLMRAVKTDSIVVIYNVLSRHAEFLAPPKLTPDSEAICPATERLSRTTGQWDGSCLMQCFLQPTLCQWLHTVRGSQERPDFFFFPRMTLFPKITIQHTLSCWVIHYRNVPYPKRFGMKSVTLTPSYLNCLQVASI